MIRDLLFIKEVNLFIIIFLRCRDQTKNDISNHCAQKKLFHDSTLIKTAN